MAQISDQTARNRLHSIEFRSRCPFVGLTLTPVTLQPRGICLRTPELATSPLVPCVFTDASRFNLSGSDACVWVMRRHYQAYNIVQHDRFGGGSAMVWGGIALEGLMELHVLNCGNLTGARYRDKILRPIFRSYAGAVGPGFLLVHKNARTHVARVCQRFLEDEDTVDQCIQWLPNPSRTVQEPWLWSGRISILGHSVRLSEARPDIIEYAIRYAEGIPAINVSFNITE